MEIKVLCVGDVVGRPGRQVLHEGLGKLRSDLGLSCVIVNAENAASGSGLTPTLYEKIVRSGADLITMGDHIYRRKDIIPLMETSERIVKPANFPSAAPGREYAVMQTADGSKIAVVSIMGRLFMKTVANCPFAAADRVLDSIPSDIRMIFVDMHAEATSEKVALGWHLDGRVTALFGTHTHIPTADERVLPKGTAYITDLGMTGPYDSVLGRDKDRVVSAMRTGVPKSFDVAEDGARLCGVVVTVETTTGKAHAIERVRFDAAPNSGATS